jgi:hypothetical protein
MNHQQSAIINQPLRVLKSVFLKCLILFCISVSYGHAADNPCGVSCTQTIANNASSSAINQANQFTQNTAQNTLAQANNYTDNAINTRVYEKVVIFAENITNIVTGSNQWAFGDGDAGSIGIPVVENWELYAVSFQARAVSADTTVTMNVRNMNNATTLYSFSFPLGIPPPVTDMTFYTNLLQTPVQIPAGTTIGFSTGSVTLGTVTGARVAVWLRRHPD